MDFMLGKGSVGAIFSLRQLMEKYGTAGRKFFMIFVDVEKAFDWVHRKVI